MENSKNCPTYQITILENREIIHTDKLSFPWTTPDPNGYFLVKIDNNQIYCGFVNKNHQLIIEFRGKNPDNIIKEILKRHLCEKPHLAYISSELMIASNCLTLSESPEFWVQICLLETPFGNVNNL